MTAGVERLAQAAQDLGLTLAVAESLTCGALASRVGRGANASTWFAGGIVAYTPQTKFGVLGVDEGPVVTAHAARQMAQGVRRLLDVDAAVAVTGVGGPGPEEGEPSGTVFICACHGEVEEVAERRFDGDPEAVIEQTVAAAIEHLQLVLGSQSSDS